MTLDLAPTTTAADAASWQDPARYWPALTAATRHLDAPVGAIHLGALRFNAEDMVRRAAGTPIRVASKSVRVRSVIEALLEQPGYRGVLAYTLAEALWLADTVADIVVGYPTAERGGIRRLGSTSSIRSSCCGESTLSVIRLAKSGSLPSRRMPPRSAVG